MNRLTSNPCTVSAYGTTRTLRLNGIIDLTKGVKGGVLSYVMSRQNIIYEVLSNNLFTEINRSMSL